LDPTHVPSFRPPSLRNLCSPDLVCPGDAISWQPLVCRLFLPTPEIGFSADDPTCVLGVLAAGDSSLLLFSGRAPSDFSFYFSRGIPRLNLYLFMSLPERDSFHFHGDRRDPTCIRNPPRSPSLLPGIIKTQISSRSPLPPSCCKR